MLVEIRCNSTLIGHSNLENSDLGMGLVFGEFHPAPAYEEFRPIFQLFGEASPDSRVGGIGDPSKLLAYREATSKLHLEVWHESGQALPSSNVHIVDFSSDLGPDIEYQVEVQILEAATWLQFLPSATS